MIINYLAKNEQQADKRHKEKMGVLNSFVECMQKISDGNKGSVNKD